MEQGTFDTFMAAVSLVTATVGLFGVGWTSFLRRRIRRRSVEIRFEELEETKRAVEEAIASATEVEVERTGTPPSAPDAAPVPPGPTRRTRRLERAETAQDAVLSVRLDQLARDLERIEKNQISRWDVALVVFGVIAGIVGVITLADWVKRDETSTTQPAPTVTVTLPAPAAGP